MGILKLILPTMRYSKHSFKLKPTPKIDLNSGPRNVSDSKATPTSDTNEDENSFKESVKKVYMKKIMKKNYSSASLEILLKRNLKFTRVTSKS